ncbi:MAG: beta-ketoacyl synthase N-terminal-like domain-containing protein [Paracoccaceae bacterium]
MDGTQALSVSDGDIAIVGLAVHVPGAATAEAYWQNLRAGVESIRRLDRAALLAAGEAAHRLERPDYVPAAAVLDDFDHFDAEFFGFSPKEAAIMDPQHRQFLEVAWHALENAGHPPESLAGPVGVFAGCGMGSYFYFNLCSNPDLVSDVGMFLLRHTGNDKDFLATRLSHVLDLKGPSVNLQTACSTSLVATHYAAQALLNGECDMALAGGVTIEMPHARGYVFKEGEILSPDGHCHAFDHRAQGTVFGSGAGVVVLRRLADAIRDGDHVWAVIKGTAVNNDGAAKAGYLAPSVEGQAAAIAEAQAVAGVTADTIDYVECHGTGTYLGDPIEVAALSQAFAETTAERGFCRLGSVKTNIGHLDTAAGVAGLVKTAMALAHREIPPSLGYEAPNPAIDFATSPFTVNDRLCDWVSHRGPRRAGVNSLGVGGTNAHAILEEAPERPASEESDWPWQILTVSGHSKAALEANAQALAAHLRAHPEQPLADIAFTLKEGRRGFDKRRVVVAADHQSAAALLEENDPRRVFSHQVLDGAPEFAFMFPGGGAQYAGMARDLYETEPVFRDWMERGLDILQPRLDYDIRALWLPEGGPEALAEADRALQKPSVQLPLIMIVEYALAQLWMSWGVRPQALIGHSMGENTAACLAGVMSFADCIGLVHLRGQLFDTVPAGGMLSVALPAAELVPLLGADLDLAAVNAPGLSVATGPQAALDALQADLAAREIDCQRIAIDIAAHSRMLEPILERFGAYLRSIPLKAPEIPLISNRSGSWMTPEEATDPDYWVGHLRHTVHFADGIATLAETPGRAFIEVGPGRALASLAGQHGKVSPNQVLNTLRHPRDDTPDDAYFLAMLGRVWAVGGQFDWDQIWGEARRNRVVLPGYAFQRARYFIEPGAAQAAAESPWLMREGSLADWGWQPVWRPAYAGCEIATQGALDAGELAAAGCDRWLIFLDEAGLGRALAARLEAAGQRVVTVETGDAFARRGAMGYVLAPERGREDYDRLIADLAARDLLPERIVHGWLVTREERFRPGSSFFHRNLEQGFYSLFFLAQALGGEDVAGPLPITVLTSGALQVSGEPLPYPEKATVLGPARVIMREFAGYATTVLDLELPPAPPAGGFWRRPAEGGDAALAALATQVLEDLLASPGAEAGPRTAALRGARRFELGLKPLALDAPETPGIASEATETTQTTQTAPEPDTAAAALAALRLRPGGGYLITGGFGGIGLTLAETLIRRAGARVALLGRSALPPREAWEEELRRRAPQDGVARRIAAIRRLEAAAAEAGHPDPEGAVLALCGDVSNLEEMRAARAAAETAFGALHGVIHAAGQIDDAPILAKTTASLEEVLSPKLHGTEVLETVFPDGDLDWLVLCSSTSVVTAPAGQADYVAANAFLNAYAQARAGGRTRVLALSWGVWAEVGMAADAMAARTGAAPEAPARPAGVPMLDEAGFDRAGHRRFTARWQARERWFLNEHRTRAGDALLPGTGYLELAAEALEAQGEVFGAETGGTGVGRGFEIRNLHFLRPLAVPDSGPVSVRVQLPRSGAGYDFRVESDAGAGYRDNAQGELALLPMTPPAPVDLAALRARMGAPTRAETGTDTDPEPRLVAAQEAHLNFGPRWRVLVETALGQGTGAGPDGGTGAREGLARLKLPVAAAADPGAGYRLHPGLLDLATGWAMALIAGYEAQHLWVPVSYQSVRVHAPLPAEILSWVRNAGANRAGDATATFDVTLMAPDGRVLVEISGFSIRRMEAAAGFAAAAPGSAPAAKASAEEAEAVRPLSPAEERLRHAIGQGIPPAEGARAFLGALAGTRAQVIVSSLDLPALVAETAAAASVPEASGQKFDRPALEGDYVAPENEVERRLAGFWEDLLGIGQVGVEDSFFDLGGHSLIAVRLFAQVKKTWNVDFPISVLFEAPTIRACAAMLAAQGVALDGEAGGAAGAKPAGTGTGTGTGGTPAPARRFTHLVAMHSGEGGPRPPFFLVAGMFGNVLNLRHLAHLLGTDRPFYGLQARGLYGDQEPHRSLVEAARDCIAEMRQVQPHGPYMVGGFSGGGITAYEIARQLVAAGEAVSALVMLDTPLPQRATLSLRDRLVMQWQNLKSGGLRYPLTWARNRIAWEIAKRRGHAPEALEAPGAQFHDTAIEAAFLDSIAAYRVAPWDGPLTLFRPPLRGLWEVAPGRLVNSDRTYVLDDNGWTPHAPAITVIEVPGDHDSMVLEPNVRVLASRMKAVIAEAEARAPAAMPEAAAGDEAGPDAGPDAGSEPAREAAE